MTGPGDVPTPQVVEYYRQCASAGLIITEGTQPSAEGKGYWRMPGIWALEQVGGWAKVADAIHAEGGLQWQGHDRSRATSIDGGCLAARISTYPVYGDLLCRCTHLALDPEDAADILIAKLILIDNAR